MIQCPTANEIGDYLEGRLPEEASDAVENHLAACQRCEQVLSETDGKQADALTRHLKLTAKASVEENSLDAENTSWQACLDSLRQIPLRANSQGDELQPTALGMDSAVAHAQPNLVHHYELQSLLGRGGMGVVYRSWHPQLHRPVAVKVMSAARVSDRESITRFQREMRAAGALDHPGIVRALDAGVSDGVYYLVMELIDGLNLSQLARHTGPLSVPDACEIVANAAESLDYAHQQKVVHRDVKPSNLLLTRQGDVKILDFGLARLERLGIGSHDATTAGRLVGTLDYLAPEQASGESSITALADICGLGATLFRLLTGQPPHGHSHDRPMLQHLQRLASREAPSLGQFRADVPEELNEFVESMLARDPERRPHNAGEVADCLRRFADGADLAKLACDAISDMPEASNPSSVTDEKASPARLLPPVSTDHSGDSIEDSEKSIDRSKVRQSPRRSTPLMAGVLLLATLVGFAGGAAGVTLWLKSGDGFLEIHSEVDDITLELAKDGRDAERLEVHTGKATSRVRVGRYELTIKGPSDHVRMDVHGLDLMRGEVRVVRIRRATKAGDGLANKDSPAKEKSPTSRGRTYDEWIDIVQREHNVETIITAVSALRELSTDATYAQTYDTLMMVAHWNESQRPASRLSLAADYIRVIGDDGTHHRLWDDMYPRVDAPWRNVVNAIADALLQLPKEVRDPLVKRTLANDDGPSQNGGVSGAAKRILLVMAAKQHAPTKPTNSSGVEIVAKLNDADQPEFVQAIAHYLWLEAWGHDPTEAHRNALIGESAPIARAVLIALLNTGQYPFPKEQGKAAARMIVGGEGNLIAYTRDLATDLASGSDALAGSMIEPNDQANNEANEAKREANAKRRLLETTVQELIAAWRERPDDTMDLPGLDSFTMLLNWGGLKEATFDGAENLLASRLRRLLKHRATLQPTEIVQQQWVLTTVQPLAVLRGKMPQELIDDQFKEGSKRWKQFEDYKLLLSEADSTDATLHQRQSVATHFWMTQYPLAVANHFLRLAAKDLPASRPTTPLRSPTFRAPTISLGRLSQLPPLFVLWAAANHDEHQSHQAAAFYLRSLPSNIEELRLRMSLKLCSAWLLRIANHLDGVEGQPMAWHLAQLGGAQDKTIQTRAIALALASTETQYKRNGATVTKRVWTASPTELSWCVECILNATDQTVSVEHARALNARVLATAHRQTANLIRTYSAMMKINTRVGPDSDPEFKLLRTVLGDRIDNRVIQWPSGNRSFARDDENMLFAYLSNGAPLVLVRQAIETIIRQPPNSRPLLEYLKQKSDRLNQNYSPVSRFDNVRKRLEMAVRALEGATTNETLTAP